MNLEQVRKWVKDAVADGWSIKPTYGPGESLERAATLEREGFKALAIMREHVRNTSYGQISEAMLTVWGPDGLSLKVPSNYNFEYLKNALNICGYCKESVTKTVRIGFAGRCCPECRILHLDEVEYPGWCD